MIFIAILFAFVAILIIRTYKLDWFATCTCCVWSLVFSYKHVVG